MSTNILRIISLFLAISGIADAVYYHDYYRTHNKFSNTAWSRYFHHNIPGMKIHVNYFDSDLSQFKNPMKLVKPVFGKPIVLFKLADYQQSQTNKSDVNDATPINNPVSNEESNSVMENVNNVSSSSSESAGGETDGKQTVLEDGQKGNISTSKYSTESSNITTQPSMEANDTTSVLEVNSMKPEERDTSDNQTLVSDNISTSIPPNTSTERDLDFSSLNKTSDGSTDNSTTDHESTSTGDEERQTSESETGDQETTSKTESTSTGDVSSSTLDFTEERTSKAYSTLKVNSTSSTDSQKVASESSFELTESSASSNIYTSPEPSVSNRVTDKITNRRYSVSYPKTNTPSSTEFPENNILEQPEQVIEVQSIRTLKIVVSVVFMGIAFVAGTVLIAFIFKVKRREVQYDQLTLLP